MPNFKKSDGFSLGGSPFTMKKGSKELDTEGSFREEAKNKMGSYKSPLFAIKSDGVNAGLDAMAESKRTGDEAKKAGMESIGSGVEDVGSEIMSAKEESPTDESSETESKAYDAFKNSDTMANTKLTEGIIKQ